MDYLGKGLKPGQTYTVQVRSKDSGTYSPWSPTFTFTVAQPPAPTQTPTVTLSAKSLGYIVTVSNSATVNDFGGIKIYASASSGFTPGPGNLVATALESSVTINNASFAPVYVRVSFIDSWGQEGPTSVQQSVTPLNPIVVDTAAPAVPTAGFSSSSVADSKDVSGQTSVITVNWTGVADTDLTGYKIKFGLTNNSASPGNVIDLPSTPGASAKSTIFYGVSGQTYYWWVASYDNLNNVSAWSATQTMTAAGDSTAPAIPTSPVFVARPAIESLIAAFTWTAPATTSDFNPGLGIGYYEAMIASDSGFTVNVQTTRSQTPNAVFNVPLWSTTYYAKVRAVDTSGNASSYTSNISQAVGADPAMTTATAATSIANGKNTIYYAANASPPSAGATGDTWFVTDQDYKIRRATAVGSGSWSDSPLGNSAIATGSMDVAKLTVGARQNANAVPNGGFEDVGGNGLPVLMTYPDYGGTYLGTWTSETTAANVYSGSRSLKVTKGATAKSGVETELVTCLPGEVWYVSATAKADTATDSTTIYFSFYDSAGAFLSEVTPVSGQAIGTSFSTKGGQAVVPAAARFWLAFVEVSWGAGSSVAWIDNLFAERAVTAASIVANTITAGEIAANAITADEIAANAITAGKIAAGSIVAGDIAANTITASKISTDTSFISQALRIGGTAATQINFVAGVIAAAGKIYSGSSGVYNNVNTGFYLDGDGNFSLKDKLSFNGTSLTVNGTIQATAGYFSGNMAVGNGGTMKFGIDVNGTNDGIYIDANNYWYNTGAIRIGSATTAISWDGLNLTVDGNVRAKSGEFTGNVLLRGGALVATAVSSIATKAVTSNVATLTTTSAHGLSTGNSVVVSGVGAPFDGTFTLASASGSTMTYALVTGNVTSVAVTSAATVYKSNGARVSLTSAGIEGRNSSDAMLFNINNSGTSVIGPWTIGTASLSGGSGGSEVGLAVSGSSSFWAGGTQSAAPFRVSPTGLMIASAANISGGAIASSVITDSLSARSITADKILIGGTSGNMMEDGGFEDAAAVTRMLAYSSSGPYRDTSVKRSGAAGLTLPMASFGQYSMVYLVSSGNYQNGTAFSVSPGEKIVVSGWASAVSSPTENIRITAIGWNVSGVVQTYDMTPTDLNPASYGSYTKFSVTLTVPANVVFMAPGIKKTGTTTTGYWCFDDMVVARAVVGELIVDGAIDGKIITGALIRTAATGNRLEINSPSSINKISAYSGHASETSPGYMYIYGDTNNGWLDLMAPVITGGTQAGIKIQSNNSGDSRLNFYAQGGNTMTLTSGGLSVVNLTATTSLTTPTGNIDNVKVWSPTDSLYQSALLGSSDRLIINNGAGFSSITVNSTDVGLGGGGTAGTPAANNVGLDFGGTPSGTANVVWSYVAQADGRYRHTLARMSSSLKHKEPVGDYHVDPQDFMRIRPAEFIWKADSRRQVVGGLILEEINELPSLQQFVQLDQNAEPQTVDYDGMTALLIDVVQRLIKNNNLEL